jgi:hypothetical protein
MLRVQLGDSLETARLEATQRDAAENATADVGPVLAELSGRLAAVEDMVTVLSGQAAAADGAGMAESVGQLEHRVARLRGVFDALRVES